MALNSASNVLRETNNPPLTNNGAPISNAQYDQNIINFYNDLVALNTGGDVDAYDPLKEYDSVTNKFVSYSGLVWLYINAAPSTGTTPTDGAFWTQVPPSVIAHVRNKDLYLDYGGANQVSASELKTLVDNQDEYLYNKVVNDIVTSATGSMETFDLGTTVAVPTMSEGDKLQVEMNFNNAVAPTSGGFGLYFLWDNIQYTPQPASTPTYGNSPLQLPYTSYSTSIRITVTQLSGTDMYVQYDQKINDILPTPGDTYTNGACWHYLLSFDASLATHFEVQSFVSAGGSIQLEYLSIKHIKS